MGISCTTFGQDCFSQEEFESYLKSNIKAQIDVTDSISLYTTIFVKFKIDSLGSFNSIWVNGIEFLEVDYNKYIDKARVNVDSFWKDRGIDSPLATYYLSQKKLQTLKKDIVHLLLDKRIKYCNIAYTNIYYVLPIIVDYRGLNSSPSHYFVKNALNDLFKSRIENYFLLKPLLIEILCKHCPKGM